MQTNQPWTPTTMSCKLTSHELPPPCHANQSAMNSHHVMQAKQPLTPTTMSCKPTSHELLSPPTTPGKPISHKLITITEVFIMRKILSILSWLLQDMTKISLTILSTRTCTHTHTHTHTEAPAHTSLVTTQNLIYTQLNPGSKQRFETDEDYSMHASLNLTLGSWVKSNTSTRPGSSLPATEENLEHHFWK